jgi:nucleotide-binding universal stress UspA family protein
LNLILVLVKLSRVMRAGVPQPHVHVIAEDTSEPMESIGCAICKTCRELDVAALVMKSGHKGPLAELFMGSVSSYAAHRCDSPVVVLA